MGMEGPPPVVLWCFGGPGSPCLQARPHCGTSHSSQHTCVASSPATQVCLKLLTTPSPSCQCLLASDDCPVTFPVSLFNAWQTPTLASKPSCKYVLWDFSPDFFMVAWDLCSGTRSACSTCARQLLGIPVLSSPGLRCPRELGGQRFVICVYWGE